MSIPFEIIPQEVARLNDPEFVQVLNALLQLEAQRAGMSPDALNLSWKQHTPDGGIDASVSCGSATPDWIPRGDTVWQFKSGNFKSSEVEDEVSEHPRVLEALAKGARYVLALGRECTASQRTDFEERLEAGLAAISFPGRGVVLTGEDVARWASAHLSMAPTYFGHALGDLMTYDHWGAAEQDRPEFHPTTQQRAFLSQLQDDFSGRHHGIGTYRIEGLSGVGKSRLAFEAVSGATVRPLVLFAPSPRDIPPGFFGWMRGQSRVEAVLVVDECDADEVARLTQQILPCGDRLTLVTIGDGPRVVGASQGRYYLATVPDAELEPIVTAAAPSLQLETRALVARLASGFVRAAVLIARNYAADPRLIPAQLAETPGVKEFLDGLLGSGDPNTRVALSGASLFTSMPIDEPRKGELEMTAALVGLSPNAMRDQLETARSKHVVQKRGLSVYVTPEILAIRLAGDMWGRRLPSDLLGFYLALPTEDGRRRFLKRLASLGDDERTRDVIAGMLSSTVLFGERTDLYHATRSLLARFLTEAHPVAGLAMLERLLGAATVEELRQLNGGRRDVVATLEKLVWLPETFDGAARLLLALAEAENERYSNNATGVWQQLFRPNLSGTAKSGLERMVMLQNILFREHASPRKRELALDALTHVFETSVSRVVVMSSLGGRPLPQEWRPTASEGREMLQGAFGMLRQLVLDCADDLSQAARQAFLHSARNLVMVGLVREVTALFRDLSAANDPETAAGVARSIGEIVTYDADKLPPMTLQELKEIQTQCVDSSFSTRLRRWLGRPGPEDWDEEAKSPETVISRARGLAEYAWAHQGELEANLDWLLSDEAQRSWHFFARLGELDDSLALTSRLEGRITSPPSFGWAAMLEGQRRAGRRAWVDARLEALSHDIATAPPVLDALLRSEATSRATELMIAMVAHGTIEPSALGQLVFGNWIGRLPAEEARRLVEALLFKREPDGYLAALSLLGMRLSFAKEEVAYFEAQAWPILENTAGRAENSMDSHYWEVLGNPMLQRDPTRLAAAALKMLDADEYLSPSDPRVKLLVAAVDLHPAGVLAEVSPKLFGDWKQGFRLRSALKGQFVERIPLEVIKAWLPRYEEEGAVAIMEMTAVGPTLSPVQRLLLETFPGSREVKGALLASMHTGVSWGPRSQWLEERLAWVRGWASDASPVISGWARGLIPDMEEDIARTREREEERDLGLEG